MKKIKAKTKPLVEEAPKRKRGRPRKVDVAVEAVAEAPKKKRGRPRKVDVAVKAVAEAPKKKRGRPSAVKETKEENLHKVAKLGKRKYKQAIEDMAMEKINKNIRRKNGMNNRKNGNNEISEIVSVKNFGFRDEDIVAGPDKMPEGRKIFLKKEQESLTKPAPKKKVPKLSKIELNRYIKRLIARGINPVNIKVLENTPQYFRIEFNDGKDGPLTVCGHVKSWDI